MSATSLTAWLSSAAAAAATFAATWLLARLAPQVGWIDAGDGARKLQRDPLPLVGGVAIALGLALAWGPCGLERFDGRALDALLAAAPRLHTAGGEGLSLRPIPAAVWAAPALIVALMVGLVDDLLPRGLRPLSKLGGQALAGLVLAGPCIAAGRIGPALLLVAGTLVALNALNTYDNADGAAAGLAWIAFLPVLPIASAALTGFLPFNLRRADGRSVVGRLPRAILGDAGSHLLGMLILLTPSAWPALALPLLDLVRVCVERVRAGQRPWVGDRRHLAHRFQQRGLSPLLVTLLLALTALPSAVAGRAGGAFSGDLALLGIAATAGLFGLGTWLSRPPAPTRLARRPDFELGT